jgi:hypothetical protein
VSKQGQPQGWAVIREVRVVLEPSMPAVFGYTVSFANDWVEALSLKVSATIPETAVIPKLPTEIENALASLTSLTVAGKRARERRIRGQASRRHLWTGDGHRPGTSIGNDDDCDSACRGGGAVLCADV